MIFPHLASRTINGSVNGRIHVVGFSTSLDGNMPITTQDDVHSVTVFFEAQNSVDL
jgi:hypothetical protein